MLRASYINKANCGPEFDHWHNMTCRQFSITECDIPNEPDFSGSVQSWNFGALTFGDVSARTRDRHLPLVRSASDIRSDPRDHFMLFLIQSGEIGFLQSDRSATAKPGDIVLYDQARPFTVDFMGDARGLVVAVPRPHAASRLDGFENLTARRLSAQSYPAKFARSVLSQLQSSQNEDPAGFSPKMEASALDLIFGSIEQSFFPSDLKMLDRREGQLRKVKNYMLDNLQEPDMNIDSICSVLGVSPRSLNRLFSSEGMTPMRWLWKKRLEGAFKAIAGSRPSSITDVAYDFGFRDVSHFSRAFRKEFGHAPSALLRRS